MTNRLCSAYRTGHVLLASVAVGAALIFGMTGAPQSAEAVCAGNPIILCTGTDANGFSTSTFADTTLTMDPATTGSSGDTVNINLLGTAGNNDFTFAMTNPFSDITGVAGNGLLITATSGGGVQNYGTTLAPVAGHIGAIDGDAVGVALAAGGDVNMVYGSTALVTATGTTDLLGAPLTGGGVVITSLSGAGNFTVTNNGEFRTQNDAIYMAKATGAGTMTFNNNPSGVVGTELLPIGGMGVSMVSTNAAAHGIVNNKGQIWAQQNAVNLVVGGNATVTNTPPAPGGTKGEIHSITGTAISLAAGGNTVVDNREGIVTGFNGGINTVALGTGVVDNTGGSVTTTNGVGIAATAGGQVDIKGDAPSLVTSTNGPGIMGTALGAGSDVNIDAGIVNAGAATVGTFSGGVFALAANGGDATINLHGNVTTTGTWGAQGTSIGGNATGTTDAGVVVDPAIGMQMNTVGSGQAHVINNGTYNTTVAGLVGTNIKNGSVLIDNNSTGIVNATTGVGISAVKIGPTGAVDPAIEINNSGNVIASAGSAVSVLGFDPSLTPVPVNAQINNDKLLQGAGDPILTPTIGVIVDGSLEVNNHDNGVIDTNSHLPFAYIVNTLTGGDNTINNTGYMNGAMLLASSTGSNTINNSFGSGGVWNLSGLSVFTALGDNVINNNGGATINSLGLSTLTFIDGGTSAVNNTGTINVTNLDGIPGLTTFLGLDNFNNAGGLLNMSNGISSYGIFPLPPPFPALNSYGNGIGDITITTGNFNGGKGSELGIDAFLRGPGADSSSDLLLVGGSVNGTTKLLVNDTNPGPGAYNPTGILFAHADGKNPGSFFLPQPIDKGFFNYDVYKLPSALDPQLSGANDWVLASTPNERAFELPKLITGAQTIWYESSGAWLDRTADLRRQEGFGCEAAPVVPVTLQPLKVGPSYDDKAMAPAPCVQQRWGVWARGFGGDFNRNDTNSTTLFGVKQTLNGDYDQNLWGIEGGADFVLMRTISGYGALFAGVLGGYVNSQMDFDATNDQAEFKGGTVGGYLTYLAGGWYNDVLFKADLLNVDYTTTFQSSKVSPDSNSFGIRYDTGYRFNLGQGFFVDPQGTIAWVNTDMDNFKLFNTPVNFSNGDSVRGSLGGRVGYSWLWGASVVEPFFDGKVWQEFEGDNKVALTSGGHKLTFKDQVDQTWGELGGGVNVFTGANSSIFVKADALVGGSLDGFNVRGGGRLAW